MTTQNHLRVPNPNEFPSRTCISDGPRSQYWDNNQLSNIPLKKNQPSNIIELACDLCRCALCTYKLAWYCSLLLAFLPYILYMYTLVRTQLASGACTLVMKRCCCRDAPLRRRWRGEERVCAQQGGGVLVIAIVLREGEGWPPFIGQRQGSAGLRRCHRSVAQQRRSEVDGPSNLKIPTAHTHKHQLKAYIYIYIYH